MTVDLTASGGAAPTEGPASGRWAGRTHFGALGLTLLLALLAYANSFHGEFVLDNRAILLDDRRLQQWSWKNIHLILTREYWWPRAREGLYRPVTTFSYLLNYSVLGNEDRPFGYHLINFVLHCVNFALVYALIGSLTGRVWTAGFGAALFAVHPVATEAVTNIVGRADLLAAAGVLAGLLSYIRLKNLTGGRRALWLLALGLSFGLGLFSKENAIALAGLLVLYDVVFGSRPEWRGYAALLPGLALWLWARHEVFREAPPLPINMLNNSLVAGDFWTARLTAIKILGKYLWLMLWPQTLVADYSYNQIALVSLPFRGWEDWAALAAGAAIAALMALAVWNFRRRPALSFFIGFFFIAILPTSNLIVFCGSTMAERFLYLPMAGLIAAAVWGANRLRNALTQPQQKRMVLTGLCALLIAYAVRTYLRNEDWRTELGFWTQTARASPNSYRAHAGLAYALNKADPQHVRIDEVIAHINRAMEIASEPHLVLASAAEYYRIKGDTVAGTDAEGKPQMTPESLYWYEQSLRALLAAGKLMDMAQKDPARAVLEDVPEPASIPPAARAALYHHLGLTLMRLGRVDEAIESFLSGRRLTPAIAPPYLQLGFAYQAAGQYEQAAIALLQAGSFDREIPALGPLLLEVYSKLDPHGSSIRIEGNRASLNFRSPLVVRHVCAAYKEMARLLLDADYPDHARHVREGAVKKFGCAEAEFDELSQGQ